MARTGPRRKALGVKLSVAGFAAIAERAKGRGLLKGNGEPNLSEMARIMLAYADLHMPENWQPRKAAEKGEIGE